MKPTPEHANSLKPTPNPMTSQPEIVDLTQIEPVECPCGWARRAFADSPHFPGTLHLTQISLDAKAHYHRDHTEIYVILKCDEDATIELDGQLHPVRPLMSILIPAGVKHRAIGKMEVLIVCTPEFDAVDEHFCDPAADSP